MKGNKDFPLGGLNPLPLESTTAGFKVLLLDYHPDETTTEGGRYDVEALLNSLNRCQKRRGPFYVEFPPYTVPDLKYPTRFDSQYIGGTVRLHEVERCADGRVRVHGRLHITGPKGDVLRGLKSGSFILTPWLVGMRKVVEGGTVFGVEDIVTFRFHFHGACDQASKVYSDHGKAYWELPEPCWKVWDNGVVVQRTIVAAAFRATLKDGSKLTIPCARHGTPDAHALFNALRTGNVLENDHAIGEDQGFIDQFGDYHNRKDALVIATHAKQLLGRVKTGGGNQLYSEDLY